MLRLSLNNFEFSSLQFSEQPIGT